MLAEFDPVNERRGWDIFELKMTTQFSPEELTARALHKWVAALANRCVDAYLVGLADDVRPTLEKIIESIESRPEPNQDLYSTDRHHWYDKWDVIYSWRRTLGLCKWLSRGDNAEVELSNALNAEREAWRQATVEDLTLDSGLRQNSLSEHLALALAANAPERGLELYQAAAVERPTEFQKPLLQFGQWACRHLAKGGDRDAAFVTQGAAMLRASLLPNFFWGANRTEPALWLKAIYFDSGAAKTPEQAIARAYDSMPGVKRPDFVPR